MSRETIITCDGCREKVKSSDLFTVRIGGMDQDYCRKCHEKIILFLSNLKYNVEKI